jgi:hypothetical protein
MRMRNPCIGTRPRVIPFLLGMVLLFLLGTGPALAAPHLTVNGVYGEEGYLCIDFQLRRAVDDQLLESMRNGVPALLKYEVGVWRDRSRWYDKHVRTTTFVYRIHYDNWDSLYCVSRLREHSEEQIGAGGAAELIHLVCTQQRMQICPLGDLDKLASYYLTVSAEIRSLSAERVREIDSWLGGGDDAKEAGGGLLGFVIGMFTSNSKSTEVKSWEFSPEEFETEGMGR